MEDTELNAKLSELEEQLLPKDSAERRFEGSVDEFGRGRLVGESSSAASGSECRSIRTRRMGLGEAGSTVSGAVCGSGRTRRVGEAGSGRTRRVGEVGSGRTCRVGELDSGRTRRVGGAGSAVSGCEGCEFRSTVSGAKVTSPVSGRPTAGESDSRASGFSMLSLSRRASVLSQTATSASPSLSGGDLIEGDTAFAWLSCTDSYDLQRTLISSLTRATVELCWSPSGKTLGRVSPSPGSRLSSGASSISSGI